MKHDKAILEFHESLYVERFDSKTAKLENGCIIWTGYLSSEGYGVFYIPTDLINRNGDRKYLSVLAHRVAWMRKRGGIPHGKQLDHLCRTRACINDEHLEPVTRKENILRGECPHAQNARKSHCIKGHPLFGENLRLKPGPNGANYRICGICADAIYKERLKRRYPLKWQQIEEPTDLKTIPAAKG